MNLAEIRKKAHRDRDEAVSRPDDTRPVSTDIPLSSEEYTPGQETEFFDLEIEHEPNVLPESEAVTYSDSEDALPEESYEEPEPPALPVSKTIVTPAFPASAAIAFSSSVSATSPETTEMTELLTGTTHESVQAIDQLFDPLAILMAGRSSFGYGDDSEVSADDAVETEVADYQEFLCFRVCSEHYAINIMEIKEIIKPREITEVPRAPGFISGVLSLRGIIIPVFNMVKRLHLQPSGITNRERIIVVNKGEELCGILVDEVLQVVRISEGAIELPPAVLEGIDRDFVQGIGRHSSGMLIVLNLCNILDVSLH